MTLDLDAIQARSDAAMNQDRETDAYVVVPRWHQSAKDVPALVAELRAAREQAAQAELARANIQRWIQRLEASGSGRGALADDMRQFLAAYDKVTNGTETP